MRHVEGKLLPDALYTAAGLMTAIGLGEERLSEMRRAGLVKAHQNGNYRVYLGREVIDAILGETDRASR